MPDVLDQDRRTADLLGPMIDFWTERVGVPRWPPLEVCVALGSKFASRVQLADPAGFAALRGTPCLFLANHQTSIETAVFLGIASTLHGRPVTAVARPGAPIAMLLAPFLSWPRVADPGLIIVFDPGGDDIATAVGALTDAVEGGGKSLIVHAEGTRRRCTRRGHVQRMSPFWPAVAVEKRYAIVPVRFVGGLPVEDPGERQVFPVGYGTQTIRFGRAILPEELAGLPEDGRVPRVRDAINALADEAEVPEPPDEPFAARVSAWQEYSGGPSTEVAAILEALAASPLAPKVELRPGEHRYSSYMDAMIAASRLGIGLRQEVALVLPETPEGLWMRALASFVLGPRGPRVHTPATVPADVPVKVLAGLG